MKVVNTLKYHMQNIDGSVEQYARSKRLKLAEEIRGSLKIYLDTKFWILLRDARLGKPTSNDVNALLRTLEMLVAQKKALCPISVDIFAEISKQSDPTTLRATVSLIDDLSMGVSVLEFGERLRLEALHFIREKTKGSEAVYALDDLVWTKIAYVLGFVTPEFPNLPSEMNVAMQKAFVDQLWIVSLVDILDKEPGGKSGWFSDDIADKLNAGKFSHMHEYRSFKELFLNELAGILDEHKPMLADLMKHIFESDTGNALSSEEATKADAGRLVKNLLYNAFRFEKIKSELPSFRISAGLHAAIRWDSKRKYKVNDLHDIHHAVTALPYYDWFFTEHSLRHLVGDKNLGFESLFKCKPLSEPGEALSAMVRLLA